MTNINLSLAAKRTNIVYQQNLLNSIFRFFYFLLDQKVNKKSRQNNANPPALRKVRKSNRVVLKNHLFFCKPCKCCVLDFLTNAESRLCWFSKLFWFTPGTRPQFCHAYAPLCFGGGSFTATAPLCFGCCGIYFSLFAIHYFAVQCSRSSATSEKK